VATATFLSGNYTYLPSGPFGLYGPPTGLWGLAALDATPGVVEFRLADLVPVTTVNLSLELYHFVDSPSGFYPGEVSFDLPNAQFDGREIVIQQSGPMIGYWAKDTYRWNAVTFLGETINVALSPESSSGTLLIDEAVFTITGSLTPIPEPAVIQLAAAGILLLGICARFRRRQSR
jgi:hypothetical protein